MTYEEQRAWDAYLKPEGWHSDEPLYGILCAADAELNQLREIAQAAREADEKLPPHSLIFDAEYYCFAERLRFALRAYDAEKAK